MQFFPLTIKRNQKFAPTNADLARYFDPEWMPGKLKVWKQQEILKYRIPTEIASFRLSCIYMVNNIH